MGRGEEGEEEGDGGENKNHLSSYKMCAKALKTLLMICQWYVNLGISCI